MTDNPIDKCAKCGDKLEEGYVTAGSHTPGERARYCCSGCRGAAYLVVHPHARAEELQFETIAEEWRPIGPDPTPSRDWHSGA